MVNKRIEEKIKGIIIEHIKGAQEVYALFKEANWQNSGRDLYSIVIDDKYQERFDRAMEELHAKLQEGCDFQELIINRYHPKDTLEDKITQLRIRTYGEQFWPEELILPESQQPSS